MSRNLSTEQASARNANTYRRSLAILNQAAIGVVLCRTREPFRAIEALRDFAHGESSDFKVWTISRGWATYNRSNPAEEPTYDNAIEPLAALRAINGVGAQQGFGNGVFVMMYVHKPLQQNLAMLQTMKEYCRLFPETKKRLVLITTPTWELPEELTDDVVILDFDVPSYAELGETYDKLMASVPQAKRPAFNEDQKDRILSAGAGMTNHEFENAVSRALVTLRAQLPRVEISDFADIVMRVKTEVVKRSEVLEIMETAPMENIGGLEGLKDWVNKRKHCFSQEARDYGVEPPKGIALIGPPGTGKSAASKAIGSVLGLPLIKFDVSRVFNSLVGQSESRVRQALKMVDAMAPCVLMIDEADKAFAGQAGGSGGGDSGVGMRVLGAILTWMQDTKSPVFMVVTANRTAGLPSEFLRRGRLDEIFSVTVPHEDERLEVLKIHLRKRGKNPDEVNDLAVAVQRCAGYVPAEIEAAVKDSIIEAFVQKRPLTGALIAEQFGNMVPLSEAFREQFDQMRLWAEQNARPASVPKGGTVADARPRSRARSGGSPAMPTAVGPRSLGLDGA